MKATKPALGTKPKPATRTTSDDVSGLARATVKMSPAALAVAVKAGNRFAIAEDKRRRKAKAAS